MKTSQEGIALIKKFEGCELTAYQCSAGVWTIGYGHTKSVTEGMEIPDGSLVLGMPAKIKGQLSEEQQTGLRNNAQHYISNAERYNAQLLSEITTE